MGWFGTLLLAKPTTATLPTQPGVREAFGSSFATPGPWGNKLGLYDLGQGWQRMGVAPFCTERLRLSAGVDGLVAATAAPALAAYVSNSDCAQLEGRTATGLSFSLHLPNTNEPCGYEHVEGRPEPVDTHLAVDTLRTWAVEAGRTPPTEATTALLTWDDEGFPVMEDAVLGLFAGLGFTPEAEILPVINPDDPAFGDFERVVRMADVRASGEQYMASRGWPLEDDLKATPEDLDYLRFRDLLWSSVYGGGATRDELVAQYEQLTARWKKQ
ncbi:hypothetical protein OG470_04530 [Micromonospora sp. NBC_00389]|uniref:hypothetical protein n=1 Tax=Micromonospora sp. NBC_00389 TaxID=2903586 RepID=UPI002E237370